MDIKMKLTKKELAILSSTLRDYIDSRSQTKNSFPKVVGVYVGNDDGNNDHTEDVSQKDFNELDDKLMTLINEAWKEETSNGLS